MSTPTLKSESDWSGVWTALITPLKKDLSLDHASLEKLIEMQIRAGIHGLIIAGSTGEGSLLPEKTFRDLLLTARKMAGPRIPLVAGLGIGGTESALQNAHLAQEAKYDALLASPPAYIKAPQRGLVLHYQALATLGMPLCVYEIPGRAASSIQITTLQKMKDDSTLAPFFMATKDATGDLLRMQDTKKMLGSRICYLSGDDLSFHGFLCHGGSGVISVVSHFFPKTLARMMDLIKQGKVSESLALQQRIQEFTASLFSESNPIPTKCLAFKLGHIAEANFCSPLVPMDEKLLERSHELYSALRKEGLE